ncbi:MAG: rhodanese-like domain-containing protein, partial [Gaiellaceae bacterium]
MPTYRELLNEVKAEIEEIDSAQAADRLDEALFLDVREQDEWDEGHVPGAAHVPRGYLESRIEGVAPDRGRQIVVYCAGGARSAFAAKSLGELGYGDVVSMAGGYADWKHNGFPTELPQALSPEQ